MLLKKQSLHMNHIYIIRLSRVFFKKKRFYDAWNVWLGELMILLFELNPGCPEQLPEHPSLSGSIPVCLCLSTCKDLGLYPKKWFLGAIKLHRAPSTLLSVRVERKGLGPRQIPDAPTSQTQQMKNSRTMKWSQAQWFILRDTGGKPEFDGYGKHSQLQFHLARLS